MRHPTARPTRHLLAVLALVASTVAVTGAVIPATSAGAAPPTYTVVPLDVAVGTNSNPGIPLVAGEQLYFAADAHILCPDGFGYELYSVGADGLPYLVDDLGTGCSTDGVRSVLDRTMTSALGGALLFPGLENRTKGRELYRTPGVPDPIELVANTFAGAVDLDPDHLVTIPAPVAPYVVFAGDTRTGVEPHITDGTTDGTRMLVDLTGDAESSEPRSFTPLGDGSYVFVATPDGDDENLYLGDTATAAPIGEFEPDGESTIQHLTPFAGAQKAVFFMDDGTSGAEPWVTDGTAVGTVRLADVNPGAGDSMTRGEEENDFVELRATPVFTEVGGTMYFTARNDATGQELWATDGTPAGTRLVEDVTPGPDFGYGWGTAFRGELWFGSSGPTLWKSDGTAEGTVDTGLVGSLPLGPGIQDLTVVGDVLFFRSGLALFATDGTPEGTRLVSDEFTLSPRFLIAVDDDTLAFVSRTDAVGEEVFLVEVDGEAGGTDTEGPSEPALGVGPSPAKTDQAVAFTARVHDRDTGGSVIAGTEASLDGGPWQPMEALDGAFDSVDETGLLETSFATAGTHELCARGTDAAGNVGEAGCIDLMVEERTDVPIALTITRVEAIGADIEASPELYVEAYVGDAYGTTKDQATDQPEIEPFWTVGGSSLGADPILVSFEIRDDDGPDAPIERLTTGPGVETSIELLVDPETGRWTGDAQWPVNCSTGTGDKAVEVCWDVGVWSETNDRDGDGLLDSWETYGLNADGDDTIDLPLPDWGADIDHKDLFWEIDHQAGRELPTRAAERIIQAFAAAPVDAGGTANPDGLPGIDLHLDVDLATPPLAEGTYDPTRYEASNPVDMCTDDIDNDEEGWDLVDEADPECMWHWGDVAREETSTYTNSQGLGRETSRTPWPCEDDLDNDGDGLSDELDPDCLADAAIALDAAAAGANELSAGNITGSSTASFLAAKDANFDRNRRWVFRYLISAANYTGNDKGGQANLPGSDGVTYQLDAGTIMHEMGHNLGLRHGGVDHANRKPNYISIMNYDHQFGIPLVGQGGALIDFAPARDTPADPGANRASAPLAVLDEAALDEGIVLDAGDDAHRLIHHLPECGGAVQTPLDQAVDWDNDGQRDIAPIDNAWLNQIAERDGTCADPTSQDFESQDDWAVVRLPIHANGEVVDGQLVGEGDPVEERELTTDELLDQWREIHTTDLAITVTSSPAAPVEGEPVEIVAEVVNRGPNPTGAGMVTIPWPDGATLVGGDCQVGELDTSRLECAIGDLEAGSSVSRTVVALLPAGPVSMPATVDNLIGDDLGDPADRTAALTFEVALAPVDPATPSDPAAPT